MKKGIKSRLKQFLETGPGGEISKKAKKGTEVAEEIDDDEDDAS